MRLYIGKFSSIASFVKIGLGIHPIQRFCFHSLCILFILIINKVDQNFFDKSYIEEYKNVNIGNDVWIGTNAIVVDGITISVMVQL